MSKFFSYLRATNLITRSLILAAFVLLSNSTASKAQLAFDQTGGIVASANVTNSAGYTFNVLTPLNVTELETYVGGGVTSLTTPVAIWNSAGTLLTSAVISNTAPVTTTPSAGGGNFNGAPIITITLATGTYTIGAYYGNAADTARLNGTLIVNPAVSYGTSLFTTGASLMRPTSNLGASSFTGPSFKFNTASAVPEPGSVALLAGLGITGIGIFVRRRTKK